MINVLKSKNEFCTGCGACRNICPHNAINMVADAEGFLVPVIDKARCVNCGLCEKRCPVLVAPHAEKNSMIPECFAVRAVDEIREKSSSGGVFTAIARDILSRNGAVCGAAFDDDFKLKHVIVENIDDLAPLQQSKYLQSDVGDIYRRVKNILQQGREVLFTGTPCQVAAVKQITGDPDNLFTLDLLCHGVPSQYSFDRYVKDAFPNKKLSDVIFRSKRFGWSFSKIIFKFSDNSEYVGDCKFDAYGRMFLRNLGLRKSCEMCTFSEFPRHGDLSIGDFWGIAKVDPSQNDGKGTSMVTVNSAKGEKLLAILRSSTICNKMTVDYSILPNRLRAKYKHNVNRALFFDLLQHHSFADAVTNSLEPHFDIGLVSNYCAPNFGGVLTHYALNHYLKDNGFSVLMIEMPYGDKAPDSQHKTLKRCWKTDIYHSYEMAPCFKSREQMRVLNDKCDTFAVGSDQLFQYALYKLSNKLVSLDWVENTKRKVVIAGSFGHARIWGDKADHAELKYWLQRYDYISTREKSGVDIFGKEYGVQAEYILDPVFLVDKKHYQTLIDRAADCELPEKYIGFYMLDPSDEKARILKSASQALGIPCTGFSEFNAGEDYRKPLADCGCVNYLGEERLKVIAESDFFIADSFHGTVLAIIMRRNFVAVLNSARGADRFYSILSTFGLLDRLVKSYDEFEARKDELLKPINWDAVDKILDKEKEKTHNWIMNALRSPVSKSLDTYDLLIKKIIQLSSQINSSEAELAQQKKECAAQQLVIEDAHRKADMQKQQLDMQNQQLDMQRMQLDMQNRRLDEQRMQLDMQNQQLDEQKRIMEEQRLRMEYLARPWIVRKLKGGIQCLKDNGFWYTFILFWKKVFHIFR